MTNGCEEAKRQSKRGEIDDLLQQVSNYVNEERVIAEDINIILLQGRVPEPKSEMGKAGLSEDELSSGWLDTVISRLLNIKHNLERTGANLSKVHKEIAEK